LGHAPNTGLANDSLPVVTTDIRISLANGFNSRQLLRDICAIETFPKLSARSYRPRAQA
jgi:hypothetical protein